MTKTVSVCIWIPVCNYAQTNCIPILHLFTLFFFFLLPLLNADTCELLDTLLCINSKGIKNKKTRQKREAKCKFNLYRCVGFGQKCKRKCRSQKSFALAFQGVNKSKFCFVPLTKQSLFFFLPHASLQNKEKIRTKLSWENYDLIDQ